MVVIFVEDLYVEYVWILGVLEEGGGTLVYVCIFGHQKGEGG